MDYREHYSRSIGDKAGYWKEQAAMLDWAAFPEHVMTCRDNGTADWFADGELNMSYLCLDKQVREGRGEQVAVIYDSPFFNSVEHITYNTLLKQVSAFASGLANLGVRSGDTILIYMPMIPQALVAMLACARLGAIHSVVFGGFAPHELAMRIDDARPKVLISASYGIEFGKKIPYKVLVDEAVKEARHKTQYQIYYRREEGFDTLAGKNEMDFDALLACGGIQALPVKSTHPLYILYTSGTTGKPKGIVRDTGGYAVALRYAMEYFYGARPGDVVFTASDIGWVVGHSFIVYAPLLSGCTTVLYEGKPVRTPDAGSFWRVIAQHRVSMLFTAPTAIRAVKKEDPEGHLLRNYDISSLKKLFLAGERCDPDTFHWAARLLQVPVYDHWWQTESGWPMLGLMTSLTDASPKPGAAGFPVCGYHIEILDEEGHVLGPGKEGNVCVGLPLPPGCLTGLWENEARFNAGYLDKYKGFYLTGDSGYRDEDGYFYIMGRIDDVINVSGHRLSTGEMEGLISGHAAVAECAVLGIADTLRGQRPVGFVVLKNGSDITAETLQEELVQLIRNKIGAVAFFKTAIVVPRLPKTRSGKILRKTIGQIADGISFTTPSTIDDPAVLTEIAGALEARGGGRAFGEGC